MPTVLTLLEVEAPPYLQGENLAGRWMEEAKGEERPAFSEFIDFGPEPPLCAVRFEGAKLLNYQWGKFLEIYDLVGDPGETENRFMQMARQGKSLFLRLDGWHQANRELRKKHRALPEGGGMDPELMKRLKQLGYGY
jgi:hypothetical protein